MDYSKSIMLYQDEPEYGLLLKLIIIVPPAILLATSIGLSKAGESSGSLAMLFEFIFITFLFWVIFPRSFRIYEDHISIKLGGPFAVNTGFDTITSITVTNRQTLSVNFATRITKDYVEIVKTKGLSIAITPKNNAEFVENANRSLTQWRNTRERMNPKKSKL